MKYIFLLCCTLTTLTIFSQSETTPCKALYEAVRSHDVAKVEQLLASGIAYDCTFTGSRTTRRGKIRTFPVSPYELLFQHLCKKSSDVAMLNAFVKYEADVNTNPISGGNYQTPLELAYQYSSTEMVNRLLELGAIPNQRAIEAAARKEDFTTLRKYFKYKGNPSHGLETAAEQENLALVKFLVENGADVNAEDAFFEAIENEDVAMVQYFLAQGVNLQEVNHWKKTPLDVAHSFNNTEIIALLGGETYDPKTLAVELDNAISSNNLAAAEALLHKGANPNLAVGFGEPPLYEAVDKKRLAIATLLLKSGANPDLADSSFDAPLLAAAENCDKTSTELLLKFGASKEKVKNDWIEKACDCDVSFLQFLVENGASVEYADMVKFYKSDYATLHFLKENGATLEKRNFTGETILNRIAIHGRDTKTLKALLDLGIDTDTTDKKGNTALHTAAQWGNMEMVKLLIARGATINAKNNAGFTPVDVTRHHRDIKSYLISKGGQSGRN